ncbi:hypothetical protein K490DRAFT_51405 [Saccharata proteae CBS 121410]|uniref:Exocyst complex component EXO84 n=1 Tax=Saccharata proteae CBS 121410 TaxID=1314787 RepID=A0A9P4LUX7_9PEZI|nr:hypothetical protein K490DRAFT_51405 [Saccharata proteae CBS 121410]
MEEPKEKEKTRYLGSLRKKKTVANRPKISAPKQISGPLPPNLQPPTIPEGARPDASPSPLSGTRLDVPRERPQAADKTAELVKRRYSTRFTQLPTDFGAGAPPMPSMPPMAGQFAKPPSRDGRPPGGSDGQRLKVDMKALRDPGLRAEQYVTSLLADASEEDIRNYQQDLRKVKNRTSTDLQHNVYQNRTQFIKISKEADKLKGEMRTLRSLMSELTGTLGQATSSAGLANDTLTARKQANRSSVANLEALWNTHLQTLWKRVEGSQKFLPAIPGRHIVYESGRWVELNAATWKARRRVHLILLNDHLLVAAEKKRADMPNQNARGVKDKRDQAQVQLVAVRCWPLQDVQIADLSMKPSKENGDVQSRKRSSDAINVRVGPESFTFANPGSEGNEKITFLSGFRKAVEDLRKTLEAETEERGKTQDSVNYYATRDLGVLKKTDLLETLADNTTHNRGSLIIEVDGKQQNIRWVESQLDELDINIALQHFEDAVARVDKLKRIARNIKGNAVAQDIIVFKVNERAAKLASVLTRQLVETHNWATSTKRNVDWLTQLGFEDRAREAYLEARSGIVKKRIRQCIFEGDLHHYIYQISFIYFSVIRNTVQTYQTCFPPVAMSACVKWAKDLVEDFNAILARQLSSVERDGKVFQECVDRAKSTGQMVQGVGLDFKDLIGRGAGEVEGGEEYGEGPTGLGIE